MRSPSRPSRWSAPSPPSHAPATSPARSPPTPHRPRRWQPPESPTASCLSISPRSPARPCAASPRHGNQVRPAPEGQEWRYTIFGKSGTPRSPPATPPRASAPRAAAPATSSSTAPASSRRPHRRPASRRPGHHGRPGPGVIAKRRHYGAATAAPWSPRHGTHPRVHGRPRVPQPAPPSGSAEQLSTTPSLSRSGRRLGSTTGDAVLSLSRAFGSETRAGTPSVSASAITPPSATPRHDLRPAPRLYDRLDERLVVPIHRRRGSPVYSASRSTPPRRDAYAPARAAAQLPLNLRQQPPMAASDSIARSAFWYCPPSSFRSE